MKWDRPKEGGEQERSTLEGVLCLLLGHWKKKKEKSAAQVTYREIKHAEFISPEASGVQMWVNVVIHVEKTITRQMPCAGLLLFPPAFALLQCNCGE